MRDSKQRRDLASIDPMLKTYAKDVFGMPDEDLVKLTADEERAYKNVGENMGKYRLVAEVTKAKYCYAGLQVGQKIVLDGLTIDTEASDCPLCMGAVGPLLSNVLVYYDRCLHNGPLQAKLPPVACIDSGLDAGELSLGEVLLDVRVEPKS
jgi:hypothetical protein